MLKNMGTTVEAKTAPGWPLEITAMANPPGARVAGEVDLGTLPIFDLALELLAGCSSDVVIDLSAVTFLDIGGARALAQATRQVRDSGRRLWMRDPSPQVRRMIDLLGWAGLYDWEPAVSRAAGATVVPLRAERKPAPAPMALVSAA